MPDDAMALVAAGRLLAEVNHPKNAQYASLRWTVSDPKGSTAKATVIHAYALKK